MAAKKAPAKKTKSDATVAMRNLTPSQQKGLAARNKVRGGMGETASGSLAKTVGKVVKAKTGKTLSPSQQLKASNEFFDTNKLKGLSPKQTKELQTVWNREFKRVVNPRFKNG